MKADTTQRASRVASRATSDSSEVAVGVDMGVLDRVEFAADVTCRRNRSSWEGGTGRAELGDTVAHWLARIGPEDLFDPTFSR